MKKILIVDDEPNILAVLHEQLSMEYRVDTTTDPCIVKDMIAKDEYFLIISDYSMPKMSGECLSKVVNGKQDIAFIILSGHDDIGRFNNHPNINFAYQKPISAKRLKHDIKLLIGD